MPLKYKKTANINSILGIFKGTLRKPSRSEYIKKEYGSKIESFGWTNEGQKTII